jgi:phosphopantothenoylcysteine decarboxylase/phosphopantothenate--cysteine ligase
MEWATKSAVVTEVTGKVEHVKLAEGTDLVVVAPATAHTISKIACGLSDGCVTLTISSALGSGIPVIIAPAMSEAMYKNPVLIENVKKLKALGVQFVEPKIEERKAKLVAKAVVEAVVEEFARRELSGRHVVVTAGPTRETLDPIRVLTNRSSGKMGVAIAEECARRGAYVTLVYGPGTAPPPPRAKLIKVETAEDMRRAVLTGLGGCDVAILAAAASDYGFAERFDSKLPSDKEVVVRLQRLPKIYDAVKKVSPDVFLVGFKAEYKVSDEELVDRAYECLQKAGMDLIVANDVGREQVGFESDTNEVFIIDKQKRVVHIPLSHKREVARRIIDEVVKRLHDS